MGEVRVLVRILAVVVLGLFAFLVLGPMAPEGTFVREWAFDLRQLMNAWWGFPLGLSG